MADFAIVSPKLPVQERMPKIALKETFLSDDSVNVYERYGEYRKKKGRLPMLYDADSEQIQAPTDVYTITNINAGTKTITITGDHSAGTTALAVGDTIRVNGGTTEANNSIFTVASLPTTSTIVVAETLSAGGATLGTIFVGYTPIIASHMYKDNATGSKYLIIGTAYHLFLWTVGNWSLTVKFTCSSACERWEIVTHQRNVYATNNIDVVQWYNIDASIGNSFADLDSASGLDLDGGTTYITKAKHLFTYKTYLLVGNVAYNDGTIYPYRIAWCSLATGGAAIDFATGDSGIKDFMDTEAGIMGFAVYRDDLVVATGPEADTGRMYIGWVTTASTVFSWKECPLKVGTISGDTLINDKAGNLYFIATDLTIRELMTPAPISYPVDKTVKRMNTSVAEFFQATYIDEYNKICFALAIGSSDTNDTLIEYDTVTGHVDVHEVPVRSFGTWMQETQYTYDTLAQRTYDDWGAAWLLYDTSANVVGFALELVFDYLGKTYALNRSIKDAGIDFEGAVAIATNLNDPFMYKRINNGCYIYLNRKSEGTVEVHIKRDGEESWQSLGSVSMAADTQKEYVRQHLHFDHRFLNAEFKFVSSDDMELIGVTFIDYEMEDER